MRAEMRDTAVENPRGSRRIVRDSEGLKERFISEGKKILFERKDKVSENVRGVSDALRLTARDMEESRRYHSAAAWADYAAEKLADLSETLRERDIDHILSRATLFIHRHKGTILAGAFIIGFALPKVVKNACEPGAFQSDISYPVRQPLEESPSAEIIVSADTEARRYVGTESKDRPGGG